MTTLTDKDQSIITQVAAKITSELVMAAFSNQENTQDVVTEFVTFLPQVNEALLEAVTGNVVQAAFPGSVPVAPGGTPYVPNEVSIPVASYTPNVPAAPAPIPGVADGDPQVAALWVQYFNNPADFYDNRTNKRNPKGPDFKHKSSGDALWINDKKNPSWVKSRLG